MNCPRLRKLFGSQVTLWVCFVLLTIATVTCQNYSNHRATEKIDLVARESCEAGNLRSQIQREDLETSAQQTNQLDIGRILDLSPEAVDEVRRLSRESTQRRIERLPFLDCETGELLAPRPAPGKPGGTP